MGSHTEPWLQVPQMEYVAEWKQPNSFCSNEEVISLEGNMVH